MEYTPPYNERDLLQQVAQGDEAAFGRLMQQYTNLLASHIFRLTHSREQTEEIVQDVFLRIWQVREGLMDVQNFRTYLYVISRNQALNAIRSLIREKRRLEKWQRTMDQSGGWEPDTTDDLPYSLLEKAIAQVPPQQQEAWLLSRRQGLKYKEIARRMQLSEETVKKYIRYASLSISRYMESHLGYILLGIVISRV